MKLYQSLFAMSLFVTSAAGLGCSSTGDATNDGKAITSVEITPSKDTLTTGTMLQFQANVKYADGTTDDMTESSDTIWNTSDPTIATVSKTGMVAAIKVGLVDISATYKTEKANEHLAVTP